MIFFRAFFRANTLSFSFFHPPCQTKMRAHTIILTLTLAAAALANPVDRRPPPLLPQRADTLILGGAGTPEAGSLDSMPALRKFGCSGNACDDGARKGNGLGESERGSRAPRIKMRGRSACVRAQRPRFASSRVRKVLACY
jgi:hypothetical protein